MSASKDVIKQCLTTSLIIVGVVEPKPLARGLRYLPPIRAYYEARIGAYGELLTFVGVIISVRQLIRNLMRVSLSRRDNTCVTVGGGAQRRLPRLQHRESHAPRRGATPQSAHSCLSLLTLAMKLRPFGVLSTDTVLPGEASLRSAAPGYACVAPLGQ